MRNRQPVVDNDTVLPVAPYHTGRHREEVTTIPQQQGARGVVVEMVANSSKRLRLFECTVPGCNKLWVSEDVARKCCGKMPLCADCGHKTGRLCAYQLTLRCDQCQERRNWRSWLRSQEADETDHLFWSDDEHGTPDDFWEWLAEEAETLAISLEEPIAWCHFYDVFESARPYNSEAFQFSGLASADRFRDRIVDLDDVWDGFELPDGVATAIDAAYELIAAALKLESLGFTPASTRPRGLLAELPDRVAEYFARATVEQR